MANSRVEKDRQEQLHPYFTNKDFWVEVKKGNIARHSVVHKFGRNEVVPMGGWEQISQRSVASAFLTAPTTMRLAAGDVLDDVGGAGAREVTIQGIGADFSQITVQIDTNGVDVSASTSETFWRVYRAWVSASGTYDINNVGDVVVETTAGADQIMIGAGEGQSEVGAFAIPVNHTGYLGNVTVTVDSGKAASIRCIMREQLDVTSAPVQAHRIKKFWTGIVGRFDYNPNSPSLTIPEKTDIWFEARGDGGTASVSVDFEILLVEDGIP